MKPARAAVLLLHPYEANHFPTIVMKKLFLFLFAGLLLTGTGCENQPEVIPKQKVKADGPSVSKYQTPSGRDINK
jgi:hypothetical protein